jgi:hypothetical protein
LAARQIAGHQASKASGQFNLGVIIAVRGGTFCSQSD